MATATHVAHQFDEAPQQRDASTVGMWVFLATEVMFFGAMFFAYAVYRHAYPETFAALGRHMDLGIGTFNTALLLTSSFCVALAVHFARERRRRALILCLALTAAFGLLFDILKLYEYYGHIKQGVRFDMGWALYYTMTGVHAVHVLIGIILFLVLATMAARGGLLAERSTPVQMSALYWHFVDLIWLFLYPLFYFLGGPLL